MKPLLLLVLLAGSMRLSPGVRLIPSAPTPCTMTNGQPRPYPCEFQIVAIYLRGKNDELLGTLKPGSTSVQLPKSKAVSNTQQTNSESFVYNASLAFRRINPSSFPPKPVPKGLPGIGFYNISTATVDYPLLTKELTLIERVDVGPTVPSLHVRPSQVAFALQLTYTKGQGASLIAPVKYIQIANPITFTKFPSSVNQCRDRAEAFLAFNVSVDLSK